MPPQIIPEHSSVGLSAGTGSCNDVTSLGSHQGELSAFSVFPLVGGKATSKSKFAKVGLASASLLAISTCMLALFGEQTAIDTSANLMQEDPVLQAEAMQDYGSSSSGRFRRQLRGVDEYSGNGTARGKNQF
jgi:hypothetical protein